MSTTVAFTVAKGKSVLEQWALAVDGDTVTATEVPAEPDVVFTISADDAAALRSGALDLSVGFMQGRLKMSGDFGALLAALPHLRGPLQVA